MNALDVEEGIGRVRQVLPEATCLKGIASWIFVATSN
jgi:hypothetical protein